MKIITILFILFLYGCSTPGTYLTSDLTGIAKSDIVSCGMYACEIRERVLFHQERTNK